MICRNSCARCPPPSKARSTSCLWVARKPPAHNSGFPTPIKGHERAGTNLRFVPRQCINLKCFPHLPKFWIGCDQRGPTLHGQLRGKRIRVTQAIILLHSGGSSGAFPVDSHDHDWKLQQLLLCFVREFLAVMSPYDVEDFTPAHSGHQEWLIVAQCLT